MGADQKERTTQAGRICSTLTRVIRLLDSRSGFKAGAEEAEDSYNHDVCTS